MKRSIKLSKTRFLAKTRTRNLAQKKVIQMRMKKTVCPSPSCRLRLLISKLVAEEKQGIEDRTETNLVNLRRIIYLTIMNALNYEEAVHKLLKVQLQEGQEASHMSHI